MTEEKKSADAVFGILIIYIPTGDVNSTLKMQFKPPLMTLVKWLINNTYPGPVPALPWEGAAATCPEQCREPGAVHRPTRAQLMLEVRERTNQN